MLKRARVLLVPSPADPGPYLSLGRLERTTRAALGGRFELFEGPPPWPRLDAVVDLGASLAHAGQVGRVPTLVFALGNLPAGASLLWHRRSRLSSRDVVLLNCSSDLRIYQKVLAASGPRPALLPLGIDTDRFRPPDRVARTAARAALGLDDDAFVLLHAGRLDAQKNIAALLQILRELVPGNRRIQLVLAGSFSALPHPFFPERAVPDYQQRLLALIRGWGLEEHVRWVGALADEGLARMLSAADVFVSMTVHSNENFGYAPVEAMAAGLPVVASHWGGLKDTVEHGQSGFHVETVMTDNGPRAVWRQALEPLRALAADPALRERMGAAARERCQRLYSLAAYSDTLGAHVEEAIDRSEKDGRGPEPPLRFHREALQHWLGAVHAAARREEREPGRSARAADYADYRWFQAPYATCDVSAVRLEPGQRIAAIDRVRIDRSAARLDALDPMWPGSMALAGGDLERLLCLEPGSPAPGDDPAMGALIRRLVGRGVAFPERSFRDGCSGSVSGGPDNPAPRPA